MLVVATVVALVWANIGTSYEMFWNTHAAINIGSWSLDLTMDGWVNDALMTLFFFSIGLDVRREFALGELRRPAAALLPVAAAISARALSQRSPAPGTCKHGGAAPSHPAHAARPRAADRTDS
jgi:Na+/H+ antiporter NhaA